MDVAELSNDPKPVLMRWTTERYIALVESGVIDEGRGVELIDGQMVVTMPQGKLHLWIYLALQRAFAAMDAVKHGLTTQPTILLEGDNAYDPEFAFLTPEFQGKLDLPVGKDVLAVIEVSVTSRNIDLGAKKTAYAQAGIPMYWVVDAIKRGVWVFSKPNESTYTEEAFVRAGEDIIVPILGTILNTVTIFPADGL